MYHASRSFKPQLVIPLQNAIHLCCVLFSLCRPVVSCHSSSGKRCSKPSSCTTRHSAESGGGFSRLASSPSAGQYFQRLCDCSASLQICLHCPCHHLYCLFFQNHSSVENIWVFFPNLSTYGLHWVTTSDTHTVLLWCLLFNTSATEMCYLNICEHLAILMEEKPAGIFPITRWKKDVS